MKIGRQAYQLSRRIKAARLCSTIIFCIELAVAAPVASGERLPIKSFTTVDGLSHNEINKIVRDSRGFVWFCTRDGLSRFDGYEFTHYGVDQGMPHRDVEDLLETREGDYWVATAAGLVRFNPKSPPEHRIVYANETDLRTQPMFSVIEPEDGHAPAANAINVLLEDRSGALWCGSYRGLYRLEDAAGHFALRSINIGIPEANSEEQIIEDLLEDRGGSLWVATPGGLYRRWPDGSYKRYTKSDGLPDSYVHDLLEDHQGQLWVGTRYGGFFRLACDDTHRSPVVAAAYSIREGMPVPWVFRLFETSDHRFWVATSRGLLQFFPGRDEQGRWFHSYGERHGLSDYDITALNEDFGGNLWLGTGSAGAMRLERNGFITYDERDGLCSVNSIFEDQTGAVCFRGAVFGDERTGVFQRAKLGGSGHAPDEHFICFGRFDGQHFTWFTPKSDLDLGWILEGVTLRTCAGEWWVGGGHCLYRFPPSDNFDQLRTARPLAVYSEKSGLGLNRIWKLFGDSQGNVWISSMSDHPLWVWERARQKLQDLSTEPGFPSDDNMPRSFGEDHAGNVWIGFNGRIARCHKGALTIFGSNDGVPPGVITTIYTDHAGRIWLTSSRSGLIRVDEPQAERPGFIRYTTAQGLSSDSTETTADHLIVEDLRGHIYVCTALGLDRLDPATGDFRHFTTADGLAAGTLKASLRDRDGGLWFGTTRGLTHFVPIPDQPEDPPPILITDLHVGGPRRFVSALGESEILLPDLAVDQSQLQIDFIGLSFVPGVVLNYQYKLEGADPDWNMPTEQRSVNYARLAPGRYRFLVRAVNPDGVVSFSPATIEFRILPPFWLRWWFVTLVAIGMMLMLYAVYRYRVAQLVEIERVRTRIATDLHDDIGSSLSRMAILSEVAKRRMESAASESVSILSEIAESARGTVDSMSDIVWAIDPRRDDLRNVVFRVRQFASDLLGAKGIGWQFQAPAEFDKIKLSPQQRRQLFLIFKEAINNAARHADCGSVCLSLAIVHNEIIGEIQDDGCGFDAASTCQPENGSGGHGLENIRARAVQLGGRLTIDSSRDKGTNIRVEVPLKRAMA